MKEKKIISLENLFSILENEFFPNENTAFYRGLSDSNFELIPGIGRLQSEEHFKDPKRLLLFEKDAFKEFSLKTLHELNVQNEYVKLAVAQHHGLRTRLLDWTLSPLIALFFAVEDENTSTDGELVCFNNDGIRSNMFKGISDPFSTDLDDFHWMAPPPFSKRIEAQQSMFLLFKNPLVPFSKEKTSTFIIPGQIKNKIKKSLYKVGITYSSLFPDLDGLCKSINYFKLKKNIH